MKNTITVTIPFSFKGVEYSPSAVVDLDVYALNHDNFDSVFHHVAKENKIDRFSYEYEVLESSPLIFSQPSGRAADFLNENTFDLVGFKQGLGDARIALVLEKIALENMNVENLDEQPELKAALFQAYQSGANQ